MADESLNSSNLTQQVDAACRADDVASVARLISLASTGATDVKRQEVLDKGLRYVPMRSAKGVLSYLIEQGVDVRSTPGRHFISWDDHKPPTKEFLELLLKHGWNIDSMSPAKRGLPLLWYIVRDHELVRFCLDRGASVDPPDDTPRGTVKWRQPILQKAALNCNLDTFELLRSRGAPLNRETLPLLVTDCAKEAPKDGEAPSEYYKRHMEMVCHLIDIVGVDVNVISAFPNSSCSTPLCRIACIANMKNNARELIWFLLDRGGDPHRIGPTELLHEMPEEVTCALDAAKRWRNNRFTEAVEEWQAKKRSQIAGSTISHQAPAASHQHHIDQYLQLPALMAPQILNERTFGRQVSAACKTDDVACIAQFVSQTSTPDSKIKRDDLLSKALLYAAKRNALKILDYLVAQGVDVRDLDGQSLIPSECDNVPSVQLLEWLVAHGWDINSRHPPVSGKPLLWDLVMIKDRVPNDEGLIEWCLEHGASVDLLDDTPYGVVPERDPILLVAVRNGNMAIFDLLLSKGAPLTPLVLPEAVTMCAHAAPAVDEHPSGEPPSESYKKHLGMVQHLIDDLGIDVNTEAAAPNYTCSTPLCRVACQRMSNPKELIWLLLDRGGDSDLAIDDDRFENASQRALFSSAIVHAKQYVSTRSSMGTKSSSTLWKSGRQSIVAAIASGAQQEVMLKPHRRIK